MQKWIVNEFKWNMLYFFSSDNWYVIHRHQVDYSHWSRFFKKRFCIVLKNIFIFNWQIVTAYTYRCSVSLRNLKLTYKVMCFIMAVLLFHYMAMDLQCTILYSSSPLFYFTVHCLLLITLPSPKYPTLFRSHIIFLFLGFSFWWNVSPLFGQLSVFKTKIPLLPQYEWSKILLSIGHGRIPHCSWEVKTIGRTWRNSPRRAVRKLPLYCAIFYGCFVTPGSFIWWSSTFQYSIFKRQWS